jgi:hypothetical protein
MFAEIIDYLREVALTSTRLARACPHLPTVHGLEAIAASLTAYAKELEELDRDSG